MPKSKTTKIAIIASIFMVLIVLGAVGTALFLGEKDSVIQIFDGYMVIRGMYGLRIDFADVSEISLLEQSMNEIGTGRKTNGYSGFTDVLKGNFHSDTLGDILLFVRADTFPTLRIERDDQKDVYLSLHNEEATRALYAELLQAFSP